jgi:hypothetical protein
MFGNMKSSIIILTLVCASVLSGTASARPAPGGTASVAELRALDAALVDLPFGQNRAALRGWLGARLARDAAVAVAAAADLAEKARLKSVHEADTDRILAAEIAFTGSRTPWDASILTGEFGHGSGESLVVWREAGGVHFFLLAGGLLWKYARAFDASTPHAARIEDWTRRLARPPDGSVKVDDGRGERRVWEGRRFTYALVDRRAAHGGDLMVVADREAEKNLAARRKPGPDDPAGKGDAPDPLQEFLLGPGEE